MQEASDLTTRSSLHTGLSTADDPLDVESEMSEHNFCSDHRQHNPIHEYLSTSLISSSDITLADVIAEETSNAVI